MKEISETALVQQAQQGHVDSFTELARRYYTPLVAIAHSVLGDRHLAEDCAQEALAKACRNLHTLKNANRFGVWLTRICRNAAVTLACKQRRLTFVSQVPEAIESRDSEPDIECVRRTIRSLPLHYRELIYLHYYDGMTYDRIGLVLGLSKQAVHGRLKRAKQMIRKRLSLRRQHDG